MVVVVIINCIYCVIDHNMNIQKELQNAKPCPIIGSQNNTNSYLLNTISKPNVKNHNTNKNHTYIAKKQKQ